MQNEEGRGSLLVPHSAFNILNFCGCAIISCMAMLSSDSVNPQIDELLLSGQAITASEAEEMFLDSHLTEIASLVVLLDDREFESHEAIKLLMSHGSRRLEDALR